MKSHRPSHQPRFGPRSRACSAVWLLALLEALWAGVGSFATPGAAADVPADNGRGPAAAGWRSDRTNLLVWRDGNGVAHPVRTMKDWSLRRAAVLQAAESVMGPWQANTQRGPLQAEMTEEVDCGSYLRRSISYLSEPGSRVPAYLLVPKAVLASGRRAPAILALHQTHPAGQKVVVGLGQSTNDEYGVELVRRGFVVLAPPYTMLANYWPDLKALGYASGTMKSIWDNSRGLDYLSTLPFVRTNAFGTIGHSLGGHNSIFTALFDERLRVVVTSCGFDSFVDYYDGSPAVWKPDRGWCQERYMPRLAAYAGRLGELPFDFPELIAALAPRTCFISAPKGDSNFRWRSVDRVVAAAAVIYRLHGRPGNLEVAHPDCEHLFPVEMRERAYAILEEQLR